MKQTYRIGAATHAGEYGVRQTARVVDPDTGLPQDLQTVPPQRLDLLRRRFRQRLLRFEQRVNLCDQ